MTLPTELHQHGWGLILSVKGVRPSLSLTIPMRLGDRNVTYFVLFDKWGKPLYNLTICSRQIKPFRSGTALGILKGATVSPLKGFFHGHLFV